MKIDPENLPAVGTVIEWDIDDIMSRHSADTNFFLGDYLYALFEDEIDAWEGSHYEIMDQIDDLDADPREVWEWVLDNKRDDEHYIDVFDSIQTRGFVRPLTANITTDYEYPDGPFNEPITTTWLRFGDGHHRLAAAIDLGMKTVPVEVCERFTCSEDSGLWNSEEEIPNVNIPRNNFDF